MIAGKYYQSTGPEAVMVVFFPRTLYRAGAVSTISKLLVDHPVLLHSEIVAALSLIAWCTIPSELQFDPRVLRVYLLRICHVCVCV